MISGGYQWDVVRDARLLLRKWSLKLKNGGDESDMILGEWKKFIKYQFGKAKRVLFETGAESSQLYTKLDSTNTWGGKSVSVMKVDHKH